MEWPRFFGHLVSAQAPMATAPIPHFPPDVHGVIVAGPAQPSDPAGYAAAVGELARRLGWPVLADALSPVRHSAVLIPHVVTTYDVILRNEAAAERLRAETVLCLGNWPTSKVLRGWLEASDATVYLASERTDNRDALHGRTRQLAISLPVLAAQVRPTTEPNGYERMWAAMERKTRSALMHASRRRRGCLNRRRCGCWPGRGPGRNTAGDRKLDADPRRGVFFRGE